MFNSESFLLLPIDLIWIFTRLYQQLVNTKKERETRFSRHFAETYRKSRYWPSYYGAVSVETKSNFVAFETCTLIELSFFGNQQFKKGLSNMKILKDLV